MITNRRIAEELVTQKACITYTEANRVYKELFCHFHGRLAATDLLPSRFKQLIDEVQRVRADIAFLKSFGKS